MQNFCISSLSLPPLLIFYFGLALSLGLPGNSSGKESSWNGKRPGSIPGLRRSSGGGHDNPLQYSCLKNSMDRGSWRATVHRVAKNWTRLKRLSMHEHTHVYPGYCRQFCNEHWGACIFLNYGFLQIYAQEYDCWII